MTNKKIDNKIAIGILIIVVIVVGGLIWVMQVDDTIKQNNISNQQLEALQGKYQKVKINNSQLKFSFEIPNDWIIERRNSGEKEMTRDEKVDFLADVYRGDDKYADITREEFNNMNEERIQRFNPPIVSVKSSGVIHYVDTNWGQIDFKIIDKNDFDEYMDRWANREQTGSGYPPRAIGKIEVQDIVIDGLETTVLLVPTDIDEKGNEDITKSGTGGRYIFISLNNGKYLYINKQAKGDDEYEKDFEHLIQTLKIEK